MRVDQIALVKASFVHAIPISDAVATDLYDRLFAACPHLRRLFAADMASQKQTRPVSRSWRPKPPGLPGNRPRNRTTMAIAFQIIQSSTALAAQARKLAACRLPDAT